VKKSPELGPWTDPLGTKSLLGLKVANDTSHLDVVRARLHNLIRFLHYQIFLFLAALLQLVRNMQAKQYLTTHGAPQTILFCSFHLVNRGSANFNLELTSINPPHRKANFAPILTWKSSKDQTTLDSLLCQLSAHTNHATNSQAKPEARASTWFGNP
jgi:hypothetical protein